MLVLFLSFAFFNVISAQLNTTCSYWNCDGGASWGPYNTTKWCDCCYLDCGGLKKECELFLNYCSLGGYCTWSSRWGCYNDPPTPAPTASPLPPPSPAPSTAPTLFPTNNPTAPPTDSPTMRPTRAPSPNPTAAPTRSPLPDPSFLEKNAAESMAIGIPLLLLLLFVPLVIGFAVWFRQKRKKAMWTELQQSLAAEREDVEAHAAKGRRRRYEGATDGWLRVNDQQRFVVLGDGQLDFYADEQLTLAPPEGATIDHSVVLSRIGALGINVMLTQPMTRVIRLVAAEGADADYWWGHLRAAEAAAVARYEKKHGRQPRRSKHEAFEVITSTPQLDANSSTLSRAAMAQARGGGGGSGGSGSDRNKLRRLSAENRQSSFDLRRSNKQVAKKSGIDLLRAEEFGDVELVKASSHHKKKKGGSFIGSEAGGSRRSRRGSRVAKPSHHQRSEGGGGVLAALGATSLAATAAVAGDLDRSRPPRGDDLRASEALATATSAADVAAASASALASTTLTVERKCDMRCNAKEERRWAAAVAAMKFVYSFDDVDGGSNGGGEGDEDEAKARADCYALRFDLSLEKINGSDGSDGGDDDDEDSLPPQTLATISRNGRVRALRAAVDGRRLALLDAAGAATLDDDDVAATAVATYSLAPIAFICIRVVGNDNELEVEDETLPWVRLRFERRRVAAAAVLLAGVAPRLDDEHRRHLLRLYHFGQFLYDFMYESAFITEIEEQMASFGGGDEEAAAVRVARESARALVYDNAAATASSDSMQSLRVAIEAFDLLRLAPKSTDLMAMSRVINRFTIAAAQEERAADTEDLASLVPRSQHSLELIENVSRVPLFWNW